MNEAERRVRTGLIGLLCAAVVALVILVVIVSTQGKIAPVNVVVAGKGSATVEWRGSLSSGCNGSAAPFGCEVFSGKMNGHELTGVATVVSQALPPNGSNDTYRLTGVIGGAEFDLTASPDVTGPVGGELVYGSIGGSVVRGTVKFNGDGSPGQFALSIGRYNLNGEYSVSVGGGENILRAHFDAARRF